MLTIQDRGFASNCQGPSRREFLRIGGLGCGLSSLSLPFLLANQSFAAKGTPADSRAVVLLFLQGGPSQLESWDPKPEAPKEYRTHTDSIATAHAGIQFCRYYPRLAAMANDFTILRNFASGNGAHTYESVTTGGNGSKASLSAAYAYLGGPITPTGLPGNMLILPEAVQEGLKLGSNFETGALPTLTQTGIIGKQYEAFSPAGGSKLKQAMTLTLPRDRFDDRRHLLAGFDSLRRDIDRGGSMGQADRYQQQAFDIITRGITDAFDLGKEDPKTVAKYDTSSLFRLEDATRWYDMKRSSNLLGKQMLLARRLCEAGCGFITVSDCGWDMHANSNSPKNMGGLQWLAPQVDHAVAAFLQDLKDRGLSDRILLIVTGEMGRSPRLNKNGGREHHGDLTPLLMAGGGLKMGQVIGKSDSLGGRPATHAYKPSNLFATILNFLFDVPQLRLRTDINRDLMTAMDSDKVIRELF